MPNILVADDLEIDRLLVQGILESRQGFTVIHAENGQEALRRFDEWEIDLVVTDLQMPEMDGLELLSEVRKLHPNTPVVLMTAAGSEEIATQALVNGAAGYIPKNQVEKLITSTVKNSLDILQADRGFAKLANQSLKTRLDFVVESQPSIIPSLVDLFGQLLTGMPRWDRIHRLRLCIAFEQALSNAIYRGNLEIPPARTIPYSFDEVQGDLADLIGERIKEFGNRRVSVDISFERHWLQARIKDEGQGFPPQLNALDFGRGGRGLTLINAFVDEVSFDATGTEITLRHRLGSLDDESQEHNKPALFDECRTSQLIGDNRVIELTRDKLIVGRRRTSHIVLDDKRVAPHHCKLIYKDQLWYVKDLGSDSGTWINGELREVSRLLPGDRLGVGDTEFEIRYELPQGVGAPA